MGVEGEEGGKRSHSNRRLSAGTNILPPELEVQESMPEKKTGPSLFPLNEQLMAVICKHTARSFSRPMRLNPCVHQGTCGAPLTLGSVVPACAILESGCNTGGSWGEKRQGFVDGYKGGVPAGTLPKRTKRMTTNGTAFGPCAPSPCPPSPQCPKASTRGRY